MAYFAITEVRFEQGPFTLQSLLAKWDKMVETCHNIYSKGRALRPISQKRWLHRCGHMAKVKMVSFEKGTLREKLTLIKAREDTANDQSTV